MARDKGLSPFSGNFEPQYAGPFDARAVVGLKTDLTNTDTWLAKDGSSYIFVGMTTTVAEDIEENNGIYRFKGGDATDINNWVKEGSSGSGSDLPVNDKYSVVHQGEYVDLFEKQPSYGDEIKICSSINAATSTSPANPSNAPFYLAIGDVLLSKYLKEITLYPYQAGATIICGISDEKTKREYDEWVFTITPDATGQQTFQLDGSDSRVEINQNMVDATGLIAMPIEGEHYLGLGQAGVAEGGGFLYKSGTVGETSYYNASTGAIGAADLCINIQAYEKAIGDKYVVSPLNEVAQESINLYKGKTISILGDSISTFTGYIPDGNVARYPIGDVTDVKDTYWKSAIDRVGLTLLVNNSWAGTGIVNSVSSGEGGTVLDTNRTKELHTLDANPDVILINIGTNDFTSLVPLGTYNGTTTLPDMTVKPATFREGYAVMLQRVVEQYPTARILCATPITRNTVGEVTYPEINANGDTIQDFSNAIIEVASSLGFAIVDFANCGITHFNIDETMVDKIHPNKLGMDMIASTLIGNLLSNSNTSHIVKKEYDDTEIRDLIDTKQDELVSGTNIKTINNQSILGSGNIVIEGGSGGNASYSKDYTEAEMTNKVATIEHNLNSENVSVTVYDQDGKQIIPEDVAIVDANSLTVDVSTLTLTGIKVVVLASGGQSGLDLPTNEKYSVLNQGTFVDLFEKQQTASNINGATDGSVNNGQRQAEPFFYSEGNADFYNKLLKSVTFAPRRIGGTISPITFGYMNFETIDNVLPSVTFDDIKEFDVALFRVTPNESDVPTGVDDLIVGEDTKFLLDGTDARVEILSPVSTNGLLQIPENVTLGFGDYIASSSIKSNVPTKTFGTTGKIIFYGYAGNVSTGTNKARLAIDWEILEDGEKYAVSELQSIVDETKKIAFNYYPLQGKKISILGDSISTFEGWLPTGHHTFYPKNTVTDVSMTYWKKFIDLNKCELLVNNSSSGSGIISSNPSLQGFSVLESDRCRELHNSESNPDIIISFIGANDFQYGSNLGTYDGTTVAPDMETVPTTFTEALAVMFMRMQTQYPNAKIYHGTIGVLAKDFDTEGFPPRYSAEGKSVVEWNNAIRSVCEAFGVEVIDFYQNGLSVFNYSNFYVDQTHPNEIGFDRMVEKLNKEIVGIRYFPILNT